MTDEVKRDRRSRRREETEARLVDAARELFLRNGYTGTTLADVAERAGVAPRTVYVRFATKAELLGRCIGVAIAGDTMPTALADRDWMQATMTAPTCDARIELLAGVTADLMERTGPLLRVAQQAEAIEPSIAAAAQAGREDTQRILDAFWHKMAADGLLPRDSDVEWLATTATLLAHADTYLLLDKLRPWDRARYEAWLALSWRRLVASSGTSQASA